MSAVVVAGVGMHPWGKWGRDFTEYGMVAARAALADANVASVPVAGVRGRKRTVFFVDQDAAAEVPEGLIDRERYWTAKDEG